MWFINIRNDGNEKTFEVLLSTTCLICIELKVRWVLITI